MDFNAETAIFFSDFADLAQLAGVDVDGIYADADELFGVGGGMRATGPTFLIPQSALPTIVKNAPLVIATGRGVGEWTVRASEADGTGNVLLSLTKVVPA